MSKFFVAVDRSIIAPNQDVRWVTNGAGRRSKLGQRGPRIPGGTELTSELVAILAAKVESNGATCLENLVATGFVVTTPNTKAPSEFAPPQQVETDLTGTQAARPHRDSGL